MVGELRASHIIHLHRLLREVANKCEEDHGMSADRLADYEDVGIVSTDFKATKPQHETALMELSEAVSQWAEEQLDETESDRKPERRPIKA